MMAKLLMILIRVCRQQRRIFYDFQDLGFIVGAFSLRMVKMACLLVLYCCTIPFVIVLFGDYLSLVGSSFHAVQFYDCLYLFSSRIVTFMFLGLALFSRLSTFTLLFIKGILLNGYSIIKIVSRSCVPQQKC